MNTRHATLAGVAFAIAALCGGDARGATPRAAMPLRPDGINVLEVCVHGGATGAQRVRITRDPFVATRPQIQATTEPSRTVAEVPVLPANSGASVAPPDEARSGSHASVDDRLVAVVVGRRRFALLASGGAVRVVTVGDLVGSRRIVRITLRGVAFNDTSSLHLSRGI